ncbi:uncharacterized protein TM35_000043650 [Trypanosoma theileri]|uniref:EF-hand domain-containing protein n=1 Tax=Trypanosoma theileri TaxID=67003 RepID=A0A1X0P5P4_9TRYP|nr:uncharacterized protein TM35_000043650 [Trypanosoma theileri]ORC92151.1 hypothetical protein TM35_000043650 [Trypanosoma theileri]
METFKITSFLTNDREQLELIRGHFEQYPDGMTLDDFRGVFSQYFTTGKGRRDNSAWGGQTIRSNLGVRGGVIGEETPFGRPRSVRGSLRRTEGRDSISVKSDLNFGFSAVTLEDAFTTLREGLNASLNFGGKSFRRPLEEQVSGSAVEVLFGKIDTDGDGIITWEDVLQLAVEEATQSITVMTEEMRSYSFSRVSPRMKLIQTIHTLPNHKSLFAVVTRTDPLVLLSKKDFSVVKQFSLKDFDNTYPQHIEYLPLPDVYLACTSQSKTIRGWWNVISNNRMGTLNPLALTDVVRQMRTHHKIFPYSFFTGGSHGSVMHWQVPKQRSIVEMSSVNCYEGLHSRDTGGITDFTLTDEWLLTTGFDHRLLSTNLETGRSILIGRPRETIRFVEYNASYACLPSVSYTNQILLWDVRSSAVTPGAAFGDESVKQHTADIIGLCNAPGLPQVITGDSSGLVKVWDLRMLRCTQTMYADGSVGDETNVDFFYGDQANYQDSEAFAIRAVERDDLRRIRSIGYFGSTQEIVCASSESIYCVRYNHRRDGNAADIETINYACYDVQQGTIILQGPTRTSIWDAVDGFRKRVFDRASLIRGSYRHQEVVTMCMDNSRSRAFFALADGTIELRSSKTFEVLETIEMHDVNAQEMIFSSRHNMLVVITTNGTLSVRYDTESGFSSNPITIVLSSEPLRALTISDEVGLIGCCDNSNLFFVDYKQTKLYVVSISVKKTVRTMCLLGKYPIMAVGCDDGEISLWSTPPAEESYVQLVSFFIGKRTEEEEKTACTPTRSRGGSSKHFSLTTRDSSITVPKTSEESIPYERISASIAMDDRRRTFTDLLQVIAIDDNRKDGLTWLTCDDVSHRLFAGDQKGNVYVYSLCPFLQEFGFQRCSFEKRVRYRLRDAQNDYTVSSYLPLLMNTVSLHKGPINYLTWIPTLSALISCGCDRLVKILNYDGKETGQLYMDRLPPKRVMDDVGYLDHVGDWQQREEDQKHLYSLPPTIASSTVCQNCVKLEEEMNNRRYTADGMSGAECTSPIVLPTLNTRRGVSLVSWGNNEHMGTQLGSFMATSEEESTASSMKNTTTGGTTSLSPSATFPTTTITNVNTNTNITTTTILTPTPTPTTANNNNNNNNNNSSSSNGNSNNNNSNTVIGSPVAINANTMAPVPTTTTSTTTTTRTTTTTTTTTASATVTLVSPTVAPLDSTFPLTSRLVALEEKKQWRPLKEKPREFREREYDPPTRSVSTAADFFMDAGVGAGVRKKLSSVEEVIHTIKWWETARVRSPPPTWKRRTDILTTPVQFGKDSETVQTTATDGLSLFGAGMTRQSGKSPTSTRDSPGRPESVLNLETRNTSLHIGRVIQKKVGKEKRAFCAVKSSEKADEATKSDTDSFLNDMIQSYGKELHRCIRGKKKTKRSLKNISAVENV